MLCNFAWLLWNGDPLLHGFMELHTVATHPHASACDWALLAVWMSFWALPWSFQALVSREKLELGAGSPASKLGQSVRGGSRWDSKSELRQREEWEGGDDALGD